MELETIINTIEKQINTEILRASTDGEKATIYLNVHGKEKEYQIENINDNELELLIQKIKMELINK